MSFVIGLAGLALIVVILVDAFETVLLPRRVTHGYRLIRLFYRYSWTIWRQFARLFTSARYRESFLSFFGPLSVLVVFGAWAFGLVIGFALLHWSLHTPLTATVAGQSAVSYGYFSGDTFFTLGYGDLTPLSPLGKLLAILEAGFGIRLSGRDHQLPSRPDAGFLPPRDDDLSARRAGRLAADRLANPAARAAVGDARMRSIRS